MGPSSLAKSPPSVAPRPRGAVVGTEVLLEVLVTAGALGLETCRGVVCGSASGANGWGAGAGAGVVEAAGG